MRKMLLVVTMVGLILPQLVLAQCDREARIVQGTVYDDRGQPLDMVVVMLLTPDAAELIGDPEFTDMTGTYQLTLPVDQDVLLFALPVTGMAEGGYQIHGHMVDFQRIFAGTASLKHDFVLAPCHDYAFEAYWADGTLLADSEYVGLRFAEDMQGTATLELPTGVVTEDESFEVPAHCVALNQPRRFFFQWELPDFGNVVLPVDNDGQGYRADQAGVTVLNLNTEIARTQVRRLRNNLSAYLAQDYLIPPAITEKLATCEVLLREAQSLTGAAQAEIADQVSSQALWALEELELARAEQDIPRYRMGDLSVTILDATGNPVPGATVSYQQTTHDFLFGIVNSVGDVGRPTYERLQAAGINFITSGFFWYLTEPQPGEFDWTLIEHGLGVLVADEMGFTQKGHGLLWPSAFVSPDYILDVDFDTYRQLAYEHVATLVSHYADQVDIWNVINETNEYAASGGFTREKITTLINTGIQAIRENDPDARIIINSGFHWYGRSRADNPLATGKPDAFTLSIPAYLDQLAANNVDYDIIGQQLYNGGFVELFAAQGFAPTGAATWDLAHLSAVLDELNTYGKPVHVTEHEVPSAWDSTWAQAGAGWWHRPWNPATQAEYVTQFYTIAFSKPHNEAISWWDLMDRDAFYVNGGWLGDDGEFKPAFYAFEELVAGWTTNGEAITNANGKVVLRGYGGDYALTITMPDGTIWATTAHITEQQTGEITVSAEIATASDATIITGNETASAPTGNAAGPKFASRRFFRENICYRDFDFDKFAPFLSSSCLDIKSAGF